MTSKGGARDNDTILADAGNDRLYGGDGSDRLYGEGGDDLRDGGQGIGALNGGSGADIFVLRPGDGQHTIQDYSDRIDKIGLAGELTFGKLYRQGIQQTFGD